MKHSLTKAVGYVRLSRDDPDARPIAEKLEDRAGQVRDIAARHNLTLIDILTEQESGATIADRPVFRRLLEMCRRREVSHIVTPEQSRLLRGDKRDEGEIEDTLAEAGITLISHEGTLEFGSDEFDPLPYEVRAMVARHELRQYIKRRRRANAEKLRQNKRSSGSVGYGYQRDHTAPGGYSPRPDEYPVLCRILRGVLAGRSLNSICVELTEEGIPSPGPRHSRASGKWSVTSIRRICLSPFNAGRHSQRSRVVRRGGKKVIELFEPHEFVIAPEPGEWEHPITWDEYCHIRAAFSERYHPHIHKGLLTGILRCPDGQGMYRMGENRYHCTCHREGRPYTTVSRLRMERAAVDALRLIFKRLPSHLLGSTGTAEDRSKLYVEQARAQRSTRDAFAQLDEMARRSQFFISLMGEAAYEESLKRAGLAHNAAKAEEDRLNAILAEPDVQEVLPIVKAVRRKGFDAYWNVASETQRRRIVKLFIGRIDMRPRVPGKRHSPPVVTPAGWLRKWMG